MNDYSKEGKKLVCDTPMVLPTHILHIKVQDIQSFQHTTDAGGCQGGGRSLGGSPTYLCTVCTAAAHASVRIARPDPSAKPCIIVKIYNLCFNSPLPPSLASQGGFGTRGRG
jgi:hypothetical protein